MGCHVSGNALSLLSATCLFSLITMVQYSYAIKASSLALQADCVSMGVDSLCFLGNLVAECAPENERKRTLQLTMSGLSHFLLIGFTVYFIFNALDALNGPDGIVNPWIVLGFACGGLVFDFISITVYWRCGERSRAEKFDPVITTVAKEPRTEDPIYADAELIKPELMHPEVVHVDALTCGINTNMCAALLHVLSDLGRSTTTLVESIVILLVPGIPGTHADAVSALAICSIIAVGSIIALGVWTREVYIYVTSKS
jgi:Co/Zn/Cd efflux system component